MTHETKCPYCGKVNEMADDDGFVEGPREYHADCWELHEQEADELVAQAAAKAAMEM